MGIYILIAVAIVFLVVLAQYNVMVTLRNKCRQSESTIDVYLNKRFDLIPNLVAVVKGYAEYEKQVMVEVVTKRAEFDKTKDLKTAEEIISNINRIMAVVENNPNLKSSEQFLYLQKSISKVEEELQAARRIYNGDVTMYNTKIQQFPYNLLAGTFGFGPMKLFEVEDYKRQSVDTKV